MQLTAFHDSEGNIVGLRVAPPDSIPVQVETAAHPGLRMTEVEVPAEVTLDLDSPQLSEDVEKLIQNYQVEFPSGKGKLKKKPDAAAEQA